MNTDKVNLLNSCAKLCNLLNQTVREMPKIRDTVGKVKEFAKKFFLF